MNAETLTFYTDPPPDVVAVQNAAHIAEYERRRADGQRWEAWTDTTTGVDRYVFPMSDGVIFVLDEDGRVLLRHIVPND